MNTQLSWGCDRAVLVAATRWQDPQPTTGFSLELHAQFHWHLVVVIHSVNAPKAALNRPAAWSD